MAWLYHNTKDAVNEFSKKYNCDLALAEEYLKVVRGIRNQQPFYVTDEDGEETGEDVALDDSWNYTDIILTARICSNLCGNRSCQIPADTDEHLKQTG